MHSDDDISTTVNAERIARLTRGADLAPVAKLLRARHDEILQRWLTIARQQPFHRLRPDRAVADHLPHLMAGLVNLLERTARPEAEPEAPLDDAQINEAASRHSARDAQEGPVDGQGLGLYLSRGIVDAHGGRIWVESEGEGQGCAFHVVLPRHPPDSDADNDED